MATSRLPLVVVLGATGAGKSKLAIEIAKIFKGEIISADSMQVYKGLDIITNKVSPDEQQECPHHLISYLEADHRHYNIVDFRDAALPIIDDLLSKRILPIVVGGTNYYIESVIWNFLIDKKLSPEDGINDPAKNLQDFTDDSNALLRCLNGMDSLDLYSHLQIIDPGTASQMHPNNRRKIIRAIQVYYECQQTMSSLLSEQHDGQENVKSGPLRYPHPCILWVKCQQPDLNARLDGRVDEMMARGLVAELENFHKEVARLEALKRDNSSLDTGHTYTHGILQMIGFKEFHAYLQLSVEDRASDSGQKLLQQGVTDLKLATRRYARQQVRWITNRFCNRPGSNVPPIYAVDSTDLTQWDKTVEEAVEVVKAYIAGELPRKAPEMVVPKVETQLERNVCDLCGGRIFLHSHEWAGHLKSKKHKFNVKMLAAKRKQLIELLSAREEQLKKTADESLVTAHGRSEASFPEDTLFNVFL
ncbi:unnamed protein product [Candidula unifasciata]|uniref:Uncharacterized protein n=1 Tax=Candidula unifasciata TaxID=100452 RepID=A0A8S3ZJY9_9EUPU|nr:unnamed protein product [Candidula unifasciata]